MTKDGTGNDSIQTGKQNNRSNNNCGNDDYSIFFTGIAPQRAYAATEVAYPVTGGNIYFDKDTGTVIRCDDAVTDVIIPEEIEGVTVTKIGRSAFSHKTLLKSVVMADSITKIC